MNKRFSVINACGRYYLYEYNNLFRTPCHFTISSIDKGLMEAIARKYEEGKPNLVKRYLLKYTNIELATLMHDLRQEDVVYYRYPFSNHPALCADMFTNKQLREMIDAYSECGSMTLVFSVFADSGSMRAGLYREFIEIDFAEQLNIDVRGLVSEDFLEKFLLKYRGFVVPKSAKAKNAFEELLKRFEIEEVYDEYDDDEEEYDDESDDDGCYDYDSDEHKDRLANLDADTLRKFEVIREFVSRHDDFWADFEDCDAVYRPLFHVADPMRFWFYPPFGMEASIGCESDKLILTKKGALCVENHNDGLFYNILDCIKDSLDNAYRAVEAENAKPKANP